jgi:hypothetical protein
MTNGLRSFRDFFFFVDVKGIKLDLRFRGLLSQAMVTFRRRVEFVFDPDAVDDITQDIGKEICPAKPDSSDDGSDGESGAGDEAQVYLQKTCCLKRQHQTLIERAFNGARGTARFYHVEFLRDTAYMTLVLPAKYWIRKAGWLYGQWYASVKEIGNAQACYPFDNAKLPELAIDKGV